MPRYVYRNPQKPTDAQADMSNPAKDPIETQREHFIAWRKKEKLSRRKVAANAGLTETPIRMYESGATRDLRLENKIRIAEAHNTTVEAIFGDVLGLRSETGEALEVRTLPRTDGTLLPVMARIENNELRETRHATAFVEAPAGMVLAGNVYAVRAPNTAMTPRFRPWEILLCEPDPEIGPGEECAVHVDDGRITILKCLENEESRDFVGVTYASPDQKINIRRAAITKISRIVGILMGV